MLLLLFVYQNQLLFCVGVCYFIYFTFVIFSMLFLCLVFFSVLFCFVSNTVCFFFFSSCKKHKHIYECVILTQWCTMIKRYSFLSSKQKKTSFFRSFQLHSVNINTLLLISFRFMLLLLFIVNNWNREIAHFNDIWLWHPCAIVLSLRFQSFVQFELISFNH